MRKISLCSKDQCTGCMACYNVCKHNAISIEKDVEGFSTPRINDEKCLKCGQCQSVCPVMNPLQPKDYIQHGYACWNKNKKIVKNSSSGGLFTSLAETIISEGGTIIGAAYDDHLVVRHTIAKNFEELEKLKFSKYVQSEIGLIYKDIKELLIKGEKVLFVGTPCQVAGLVKFLQKDYDNLITADFVCHGVPSPLIFQEYKKWLENKYKSTLISFTFRDKRWSWMSYNTKATFQNGKTYYGTWFKDKYLRLFLGELISRKSCYHCNYCNMNRPGDITIADFWGLKFKSGETANYNDTGISLALINSNKGKLIFEKSKVSLFHYNRSYNEIKNSQRSFTSPWDEPLERNQFWKDFQSMDFNSVLKKYAKEKKTPIVFKIKQILGRNIISNTTCKIIKFITK